MNKSESYRSHLMFPVLQCLTMGPRYLDKVSVLHFTNSILQIQCKADPVVCLRLEQEPNRTLILPISVYWEPNVYFFHLFYD